MMMMMIVKIRVTIMMIMMMEIVKMTHVRKSEWKQEVQGDQKKEAAEEEIRYVFSIGCLSVRVVHVFVYVCASYFLFFLPLIINRISDLFFPSYFESCLSVSYSLFCLLLFLFTVLYFCSLLLIFSVFIFLYFYRVSFLVYLLFSVCFCC